MGAAPKKPRLPPPVEMMGLPRRLIEERKDQGLGVVELGELSRVGGARVTRAEKGERLGSISLATVMRLADALGVRLEWLVLGRGPKRADVVVEPGADDDGRIRAVVADELEKRRKKRRASSKPPRAHENK